MKHSFLPLQVYHFRYCEGLRMPARVGGATRTEVLKQETSVLAGVRKPAMGETAVVAGGASDALGIWRL
jgi:hypothetical protein